MNLISVEPLQLEELRYRIIEMAGFVISPNGPYWISESGDKMVFHQEMSGFCPTNNITGGFCLLPPRHVGAHLPNMEREY